MGWSYSGNPQDSSLDLLRFLTGDTDVDSPLLSDEEMQYLLLTKGDSAQAAAPNACTAIMAKLAREVDYAIGPEKVTASQRFEAYKVLKDSLRALWVGVNAAPSWSGAGMSEDPNRPIFDVGMHDNNGGGSGG